MLAYFCKYAPIEIFEAMGEDVQIIDPQVVNFNQADILMHPNICSFVKGTLEDMYLNISSLWVSKLDDNKFIFIVCVPSEGLFCYFPICFDKK